MVFEWSIRLFHPNGYRNFRQKFHFLSRLGRQDPHVLYDFSNARSDWNSGDTTASVNLTIQGS
jgi:hypothetical protein